MAIQLMLHHMLKRSSECCLNLIHRMIAAIYGVLCCSSRSIFSRFIVEEEHHKKQPMSPKYHHNKACDGSHGIHSQHQSTKKKITSIRALVSTIIVGFLCLSIAWLTFVFTTLLPVAVHNVMHAPVMTSPPQFTAGQGFLYATTLTVQHHLRIFYGRDDMRIREEDVMVAKENGPWSYKQAWSHLWRLIDTLPIEEIASPAAPIKEETKQNLVQIEDSPLSPNQLDFVASISTPLVKYMMVEGEYIDKKLNTMSPIGSRPPIFIVGFPRSGLNLLQKLISLDPKSRAPRLWETVYDTGDSMHMTFSDRYEAAKKAFEEDSLLANAVSTSWSGDTTEIKSSQVEISSSSTFPFESEMDPADDEYILGNALSCNMMAYEYQAGPAVIRWSRQLDVQTKQMEFHKRWAQLYHNLTMSEMEEGKQKGMKARKTSNSKKTETMREPEFWVFRGSDHVERIESILSVYPDAKFIWAHHSIKMTIRKQLELAVRSLGSNTLFPTPYFIRLIGESVGRSLQVLDTLPDVDNRVYHMQLRDLLANPVQTLQKIYSQLGMGSLSRLHIKRIEQWMQKHWRASRDSQVSWARAWRLLGLQSEQELLDMYEEYLQRFPGNI